MEQLSKVNKTIELSLAYHPVCKCGAPWEQHKPTSTDTCGGYDPSKPILDIGTVVYNSPDFLCNLLWKAERFFKFLRLKRIQSCHSELIHV